MAELKVAATQQTLNAQQLQTGISEECLVTALLYNYGRSAASGRILLKLIPTLTGYSTL